MTMIIPQRLIPSTWADSGREQTTLDGRTRRLSVRQASQRGEPAVDRGGGHCRSIAAGGAGGNRGRRERASPQGEPTAAENGHRNRGSEQSATSRACTGHLDAGI